MKTKITNRKKQAIKTKNLIYDVSVALISEHGFSNVNIEDICKAAEVSVGTFYNYYKSKNEVFFELYNRADQYFEEVVQHKLKKGSSPEVILKYFDYYAIYCEKTGVSTMTQMMNAGNKNFIKEGRYLQESLTEIIEEGLGEGWIKSDKTATELCEYYFLIVRGVLFDWCLYDGEYDLREKIADCFLGILN